MDIASLLGDEASSLLDHKATAFPKELLTLPGPDYLSDVFALSDRSPTVLRNLAPCIITVDSTGPATSRSSPSTKASALGRGVVLTDPEYFDPPGFVTWPSRGLQRHRFDARNARFSISTLRSPDPFIVKINHNDLLRYPNSYDERLFASAQLASDLGAVGIGATIYFGSEGSIRQIEEIGKAFAEAHRLACSPCSGRI